MLVLVLTDEGDVDALAADLADRGYEPRIDTAWRDCGRTHEERRFGPRFSIR